MVANPFGALERYPYLLLTTYRKNGQPVATPVWFAPDGDKLYIYSDSSAGKVKRLRHTARVTIAPCTLSGKVIGDAMEASGRVLESAAERKIADQALNRKYGWQKRVLFIWYRLQGEVESDTGYLEISALG